MATTARKAEPEPEEQGSAASTEVDALMRRFLDQNRGQLVGSVQPAGVPSAGHEASPRRDFDTASELLDRASQAFDLLIDRCQHLERDLDEAQEHARAQAAEQADTVEQWKRLAAELKAQVETSEQAAAASRTRCEAAEARAAKAEQRAVELERVSAQAARHATLAEGLSTKLHDKVVSAFGIGSRAHPVLEAVATQTAAG